MSSLKFREYIVSRVVYEIIFWGQKLRAEASHRDTTYEIPDKCVYYQIKILNGRIEFNERIV